MAQSVTARVSFGNLEGNMGARSVSFVPAVCSCKNLMGHVRPWRTLEPDLNPVVIVLPLTVPRR